MIFEPHHFLWLLPLLLLTPFPTQVASNDFTSLYKQQVIVILDNDSTIQNVGRLMYQNHDTLSHAFMWNGTSQMLNPVKWKADNKLYQDPDQQLPIGLQKTFAWIDTLIRVIGKGDISEEDSPTLSGFSAEELIVMITEELVNVDIGRIDIIGCIPFHQSSTLQQIESPTYLNQFMLKLQKLRRFQTNATLRMALETIDHSGREITGQLLLGVTNNTEVQWRHANPQNIWMGYFTGESYQLQQVRSPSRALDLNSPFFGILPEKVPVYVTDYRQQNPTTFAVTDMMAFELVDKMAQTAYRAIPENRAPSFTRRVQFLSGQQEVSEVTVIEIGSMLDFLKELRHYGDTGPADHNSEVYFRFGYWVLSMDESTFYVSVDGIITDPADSNEKKAQVTKILNQWHTIPDSYPSVQPGTNPDFFEDVTLWINGHHEDIGLELENAYNAQCGVAMFLSESIRSFHVHVTNMMSLNLAQHNYLTREYFFSSHPMGRKGTWQILDSRTGKKTGLEMLQDGQARSGSLSDQVIQSIFNETIQRISRISKSWLSHIDASMIMGSRDPPPATTQEEFTGIAHQTNLLSVIGDVGSSAPMSHSYLRDYELKESRYRLLSSSVSEPETGTIDLQVEDFAQIDDMTSPLKASIAFANDHSYVSGLISKELQQKERQTGKVYQVVPDSVEVDEQSDTVRFFVREIANVSSELEQITATFDKSKLQSKALLEKLLSLSNKTKPIVTWMKKGQGVANAVEGIVSSIHELESGNLLDVLKGTYDLGRDIYKLGDITGINKAAGKYLGKALKGLATKAGESIAGSLEKDFENTALSVIGDVEEISSELAPVIGALMNIYNIYEDFSEHTVLGYINGAFDITTTILSFLGPEAEPFAAALSVIKMGIDFVYADISKELHALPPDASVGQIVVAVLKGIIESVLDFVENIIHNLDIFAAFDDADKLDEQYEKDRQFLENMADYRNYFDVVRVNGSNASEINFAGGADSWNGGDITFHLGESGHSTLSLETVNSNGNQIYETHDIDTPGVEDIVLGIGELHAISFKKVTVHFFLVHSH